MKSPMTWEIPVKGTQVQDQLMSKKLLHDDTLLIVKRLVIPSPIPVTSPTSVYELCRSMLSTSRNWSKAKNGSHKGLVDGGG